MTQIAIDKRLNLVVPLQYGDITIHVHASPIGRQAFEANYLPIARTFASIHKSGLDVVAGPRIAALELKHIAQEMGRWDGADGVENTLMAEIIRRANVVVPEPGKGWQTIPLQEAVSKNRLDPDDVSEVLNALVFFTVGSWMYPKRQVPTIMATMTFIWGGRTEPSELMEFIASLPTSIATDSSGAKTLVSSVPS